MLRPIKSSILILVRLVGRSELTDTDNIIQWNHFLRKRLIEIYFLEPAYFVWPRRFEVFKLRCSAKSMIFNESF